MRFVFKHALVFFVLFVATISLAQKRDFTAAWKEIGPSDMPNNPKYRRDAGTGPVEFIRVSQLQPNYLLAGSISGGLFYSKNGGENWINAGSDQWDYSGSGWADFHPTDTAVWLACTTERDNNGQPGRIGKHGGVMRTINSGKSWGLVGDYMDFMGSPDLVIYGTRFHPYKPDMLFVLTSEGIYYTNDIKRLIVKWNRVPLVRGWVYDFCVVKEHIYITNFFHGKWYLRQFELVDFSTHQIVNNVLESEANVLKEVTLQAAGETLLIAKNYVSGGDKIIQYNPETHANKQLLDKQNIVFGSGYTFATSPHHIGEFYLGYGTRIRKWAVPYEKELKIGGKYHVDIEYVTYDPFDTATVYIATHGGVFKSNDNGATWESKINGLGISEVMGMAVGYNDPNQIAIGCFHDGSMLFADHDNDGVYKWRTVNGGDGLLPLISIANKELVYTSNQYTGGGISYSKNSYRDKKKNLHNINKLKTAGWEMAATLNYADTGAVFFNFKHENGLKKNCIDVCKSNVYEAFPNVKVISDFNASHKLQNYKVYSLFSSQYHPNVLIAYVLHYVKDANGDVITNHRLFRTDNVNGASLEVIRSWYELKHQRNTWIGDLEVDGYNPNKIYLSYTSGKSEPETIFGDRGMVYGLVYKGKSHKLRRQYDLTKNIPSGIAGKYNLAYTKKNGGELYFATRTGIYLANSKLINKGKKRWLKVGKASPHCKVYGLAYNENAGILTVGYLGRGVWQYQLDNK